MRFGQENTTAENIGGQHLGAKDLVWFEDIISENLSKPTDAAFPSENVAS